MGAVRVGLAVAVAGCCAVSATAAPAASPQEFESTTASTARASRAAKAGGPWGWSVPARQWSLSSATLPAAVLRGGPTAKLTRAQFLDALVKIEATRAGDDTGSGGGTGNWWDDDSTGDDVTVDEADPAVEDASRQLMERTTPAPALPDAPEGSQGARAIAYGWLPARAGKFAGSAAITSNEAALATATMLGLRPEVLELTRRLRTEVPGARVTTFNAAQALVRTMGMRYNVEDPNDELELGPSEAVNVAHGSYMLYVAGSQVQSWKLDEARRLATTFDLPTLGPNQARILRTGVRQLGQPYVWAGETEGRQAEGHGGFDCSGFTIRIVNGSSVPSAQINVIGDRTSMAQSAIPRARRISMAKLQPGDAMFFGDNGPRSTPAQNFHAGVYMGNGWFIHSSGGNGGVAINQLAGSWWGDRFSWGRRALKRP